MPDLRKDAPTQTPAVKATTPAVPAPHAALKEDAKKKAGATTTGPATQTTAPEKKGPAKGTPKDAQAKVGNTALAQKAAQSGSRRDAILEFIQQRLAQVHVVQQRELDQIAKDRVWYDEVARGKKGYALPDPTRWRRAGQLYGQALEALAQGHLGRAATLVDNAIAAERAAWSQLPKQVPRFDHERAPMETPDARKGLGSGATCEGCDIDEPMKIANGIVAVTAKAEAEKPMRLQKSWWVMDALAEKQAAAAAEKKAAADKEASDKGGKAHAADEAVKKTAPEEGKKLEKEKQERESAKSEAKAKAQAPEAEGTKEGLDQGEAAKGDAGKEGEEKAAAGRTPTPDEDAKQSVPKRVAALKGAAAAKGKV